MKLTTSFSDRSRSMPARTGKRFSLAFAILLVMGAFVAIAPSPASAATTCSIKGGLTSTSSSSVGGYIVAACSTGEYEYRMDVTYQRGGKVIAIKHYSCTGNSTTSRLTSCRKTFTLPNVSGSQKFEALVEFTIRPSPTSGMALTTKGSSNGSFTMDAPSRDTEGKLILNLGTA